MENGAQVPEEGCFVCNKEDDPSHGRHRGVQIKNCPLNSMCASMLGVNYGSHERVRVEVRVRIIEIFMRPNYKFHATQFVPFRCKT